MYQRRWGTLVGMSSLESHPSEKVCGQDPASPGVSLIDPREVPLGGPRAMLVRRTLPSRQRTMIGAWCFVDHYGPDDVAQTGGMVVPPHPHTALQTVSWLFTGKIEHRDSTGAHAYVVPGELNLMTAGHGVCHSEVSTSDTTILHGVQLWTALPRESVDVAADFEHFVPEPVAVDGGRVSVFLGALSLPGGAQASSPVRTYSPLLGAEIVLDEGMSLTVGVDASHEHGVLLDQGVVSVEGQEVGPGQLAYVGPGQQSLTVTASAADTRVILLGGTPFGEQIVMWWNFIGRSHEEVVAAREQWQAELGHDPEGRFGAFDYPSGVSLPAPPMPNARLRPRGNRD